MDEFVRDASSIYLGLRKNKRAEDLTREREGKRLIKKRGPRSRDREHIAPRRRRRQFFAGYRVSDLSMALRRSSALLL